MTRSDLLAETDRLLIRVGPSTPGPLATSLRLANQARPRTDTR